MEYIDVRSDTVTQPTPAMREAMYRAEVGDDVYGEDPTVTKLEEYGASLVGKKAALFVPSGTFGNQLALLTHCARGSEVILGEDCHIVQHEVGAAAVIAGVQLRTLVSDKGMLDPREVAARIRSGSDDIHYPGTALLCLENAHSNGRVVPIERMSALAGVAHDRGVGVHTDGARIFNAAAALGVDAREIAARSDSVMFCLSKGLCAPVGSLLAGDSAFIARARKNRKLMGGGMRQAGFLAAAGIVALETMRERLKDDHDNAKLLAASLAEIPGIEVEAESVQINMVFFTVKIKVDPAAAAKAFLERGIKVNAAEGGTWRFVTNYWVNRAGVERLAKATKEILGS